MRRMLIVLAAMVLAACSDPTGSADTVLTMEMLAGEYELVTVDGDALPAPYRPGAYCTIEGVDYAWDENFEEGSLTLDDDGEFKLRYRVYGECGPGPDLISRGDLTWFGTWAIRDGTIRFTVRTDTGSAMARRVEYADGVLRLDFTNGVLEWRFGFGRVAADQ